MKKISLKFFSEKIVWQGGSLKKEQIFIKLLFLSLSIILTKNIWSTGN